MLAVACAPFARCNEAINKRIRTTASRDARFLVQGYGFRYITSGRDLLRFRSGEPVASRSAPMVFADPAFGNGRDAGTRTFSHLPGTRAEATAIIEVFPKATALLGSDAGETRLKRANGPQIGFAGSLAVFPDLLTVVSINGALSFDLPAGKIGLLPGVSFGQAKIGDVSASGTFASLGAYRLFRGNNSRAFILASWAEPVGGEGHEDASGSLTFSIGSIASFGHVLYTAAGIGGESTLHRLLAQVQFGDEQSRFGFRIGPSVQIVDDSRLLGLQLGLRLGPPALNFDIGTSIFTTDGTVGGVVTLGFGLSSDVRAPSQSFSVQSIGALDPSSLSGIAGNWSGAYQLLF